MDADSVPCDGSHRSAGLVPRPHHSTPSPCLVPFGKCPQAFAEKISRRPPGRHCELMEQRTDIIKPEAWRNLVVFLTTNNFSENGRKPWYWLRTWRNGRPADRRQPHVEQNHRHVWLTNAAFLPRSMRCAQRRAANPR